jgi:uncharacterized protein
MLLVKTYLAPSRIHGIGLFAAEDIAEGTLMWRLDTAIDTLLTDDELDALPVAVQEFLGTYIYRLPGLSSWILDGDHARHFNHSRNPAMGKRDNPFESYALRDISRGEELTCDYRTYVGEDAPWL